MRFLVLAMLLLSSCGFGKGGFEAKNKMTQTSGGGNGGPDYTPTNLTRAINAASRILMQRLPTDEEAATAATGVAGYEQVLRTYLSSNDFLVSMRSYHNDFFQMSGVDRGINYDEPTALMLRIIRDDLDYREALLAKYCVSITVAGAIINISNPARCATFANDNDQNIHGAGVLTTQAFLLKWNGPHNFRRVKHVFSEFACQDYPDAMDEGMTIDEVANVAKGSTADFNDATGSPVCYSCHKSINPRAALFLNFSEQGTFVPSPAGAMFPNDTQSTEVAGTRARVDRLLKRADGTVPVPRYHGEEVLKLRDYAEKLANGPLYNTCMAQRFYNFMLGRPKMETLPSSVSYLSNLVVEKNYNVKELIIDIAKSAPYINR